MIIFYNKVDGKIEGSIEGRIHTKEHLNMWLGNKDTTDRIVVEWIPKKYYTADGTETDNTTKGIVAIDYSPTHPQADLMVHLDSHPMDLYKYKINTDTLEFIKIE